MTETPQSGVVERLREEALASPRLAATAAVLAVLLGIAFVTNPGLFVDQAISGLVYGMILVLIALGLSLILGLMNVVNFAHGALFMLGAYLAYQLVAVMNLPFFAALIVAPLLVGVVGAAIELLALRRLYGQEPIVGLLATFGLTLMLQEWIRYQWGSTPLSMEIPASLSTTTNLGVTSVSTFRLFTVAVSTVAIVFVYYLVTNTDFGLTVRAGVQDAEMTEILGANLPIRFTATFILGASIAGLGGVLRGAEVGLQPDMGISFIIMTFIVVVVGGVGSIFGSVVAGLLIGWAILLTKPVLKGLSEVTQPVVQPVVDAAGLGMTIGPEWLVIPSVGGLVPFVVMIVVLLARPRGLFGTEGFLE
ncbi:branched-chain amino acid ABC transporter permease [Haloarchaeobius sp. HME9146]|uniref:branched-chain amino acid ABC transporter permease n=1 Tax=Haloarchaeobius sp. HME9146 TaxID=2978732 RepID=UPI0021BFA9A3|nr:branched-chain amino acid ABC transporter permease [Haloarchaeobius sp. HME9146]MCT9097820.1 branched-chain amino acid ABC transporter permease [Haloarchaeobius sp. HME9146]